jgi:hypothetical protein
MATETVSLAFEHARAQVSLGKAEEIPTATGSTDAATGTIVHTADAVPALDIVRTGQQKAVQEPQQLQLQANELKGKWIELDGATAPCRGASWTFFRAESSLPNRVSTRTRQRLSLRAPPSPAQTIL